MSVTEIEPAFSHSIAKLRKQKELLRKAVREHVPLKHVLEKAGWNYDDLRYTTVPEFRRMAPANAGLSTKKLSKSSVPMVSFFSGAGGMDLGFEAAGFRHICLVEHSELFCNTLRHNRPKWRVMGPPVGAGDVSQTDEMISNLEPLIGPKGFDGVFVGGPPCQPFSIAANQRFSKTGEDFKRTGFAHAKNGNLLFDYIQLIMRFSPRAFLIENVPGLAQIDGGEQLWRAIRLLEQDGYTVEQPIILNAASAGVPQNRYRLFVVGSRTKSHFRAPHPIDEIQRCGDSLLVEGLQGLSNHQTRSHSAESVLRYMELEAGKRDSLGRVDRLDPAIPSKTVIAGGSSGGGRSHLHPFVPRTLSVRESARLQTFPDDYHFTGSIARQFTQVGNAVPPVLAEKLASCIRRSYFK